MTRFEIIYELDGIQYMIKAMSNKLDNLINQSCVNPSFRTRLHKADNCLDEALDQMHFAKHIIEFIIASKIHQ